MIVLGAGPVGLVSAYLTAADVCVGVRSSVSDLMRQLSPTFLWRTEATEILLRELGLPFEPRTVKFGFLGNDGLKIECSTPERIEYYRRSRALPVNKPVAIRKSFMSSGGNQIETFDVSVEDLIDALRDRVEILDKEIALVDVVEDRGERVTPMVRIELVDDDELRSRCVINTISAPEFDRLLRYDTDFFRSTMGSWEGTAKSFVRIDVSELDDHLITARDQLELSYVYVVSTDRDRYPFDRVLFVDGADDAILEFNGDSPVDRNVALVVPNTQTRGTVRDAVEFGGAVRHVGRFARWDHSIRIHDVVRELSDVV